MPTTHSAQLIPTFISNIQMSKSLQVTLASGATKTFGVDQELRFLIHFLGDIHQPLHASTNADAGGNCVKVTGFSGSDNLHSTWDTALASAPVSVRRRRPLRSR